MLRMRNCPKKSVFQVGSGEIHLAEAVEWEDIEETEEIGVLVGSTRSSAHDTPTKSLTKRRSSSMICPIYNVS